MDHFPGKGPDHLLGDLHPGRRELAFEALHIGFRSRLAGTVVRHPLDEQRLVRPHRAALDRARCSRLLAAGFFSRRPRSQASKPR